MRAARVSEIGTKDAPLALDPRANSSRRGRRIYRSASRWTAYLGLANSIVADDLECLAGRAYLSLVEEETKSRRGRRMRVRRGWKEDIHPCYDVEQCCWVLPVLVATTEDGSTEQRSERWPVLGSGNQVSNGQQCWVSYSDVPKDSENVVVGPALLALLDSAVCMVPPDSMNRESEIRGGQAEANKHTHTNSRK
ncbi:unnamed protein product [Cuscuta campestris]|uniref:Uncharacterized protein n=1 Tax=Cuscuta campestris TaxID=132261 RepID=A0A484LJH4_9ASTE|nr:unnamed protein product [Cuscuta campestris]